jgi:DivIVA domain-containing protein
MTWGRQDGRPTGPITPQLIREEVLFSTTRVPAGYRQEDVDDFLDAVANRLEDVMRGSDSLARLLATEVERRTQLEAELASVEDCLRGRGWDETHIARFMEDVRDQPTEIIKGGEEDETNDHRSPIIAWSAHGPGPAGRR